MESIYWVITHRCNQYCSHCYNHSRPGGPSLTFAEVNDVLANLPEANRLILSGGEPLVERELLLYTLRRARRKYEDGTWLGVQTNGDLLDAASIDELLSAGLQHVSVASLDGYHVDRQGQRERLTELLTSRGLAEVKIGDPATPRSRTKTFSFWGATPDLWLGGLWARGRALRNGIWKRSPEHNFCSLWSGALGFLDDGSDRQEISIQLTKAYPCCPGTVEPLGDVAEEPLDAILERHRGDPMWEALNKGEPWEMGESGGIDQEFAKRRIQELGNVCLWCDEYFKNYRHPEGPPNQAADPWPEAEKKGAPRSQPVMLSGELSGDG